MGAARYQSRLVWRCGGARMLASLVRMRMAAEAHFKLDAMAATDELHRAVPSR
jgi:hypothetical protein